MKLRYVFLIMMMCVVSAFAADITVTDADIPNDAVVNWTADNTYFLDGRVFVNPGATLNIEAGTVIKGRQGTGEDASVLVVARGGVINAIGTADAPIIFTSELDDVNDPVDVAFDAVELWGGLIILGAAPINATGGENNIEGIPAEERGMYGGTDSEDNSGTLKYVSIRHGGIEIGEGNEINGLTMGGVGSGTTIEYVEVFSNKDDGFEWFGGTVNCKHLISAFCRDDAFDIDEGLNSKMQYLFAIQGETTGDHCGEHDGAPDSALENEPKAYVEVYNATYLGGGMASQSEGTRIFRLRENWGGEYKNSIFGDYNGYGVTAENKYSPTDVKDRMEAGEVILANNIWFNLSAGVDLSVVAKSGETWTSDHLAVMDNITADPELQGISRTQDGGLDPRPATGGVAYQDLAAYPEDGFFEAVDYKGAFGEDNWAKGWTALYSYGILGESDAAPAAVAPIAITDEHIGDGAVFNAYAENDYLLDGRVFVNPGATLNIEAGTVIKGRQGTGEDASVLVVARGGVINAIGTADAPIIFTSELDDVNDPVDVAFDAVELWGGLIILGAAPINATGGENNIEGIPAEERGMYGGTDSEDNSGTLKYVSIRHGGIEIGEGNEINGLTMGGVGSGTTIEYVEVFSNKDDGFEWFGGTVNCKHLISAFCRDDAFDIDEGLNSKMQYLFAIQGETTGDHCGEHDGAPDSALENEPKAYVEVYNATYLGGGMASQSEGTRIFRLRENWGGEYKNSIFGDYNGYGVTAENKYSPTDVKDRMEAGEVILANNIWFNLSAGSTWDKVAKDGETWTAEHLEANNNLYEDPQLVGISRTQDGTLDPRPALNGPAQANLIAYPEDGFFEAVDYKGAFGTDNWAQGWTALYSYGILSESQDTPGDYVEEGAVETVDAGFVPTTFELGQNYPNPFNPETQIRFALPNRVHVSLDVYNALGQKVASLVNGMRDAGQYTITWNAAQLQSGMYVYQLNAGSNVITKKMLLTK